MTGETTPGQPRGLVCDRTDRPSHGATTYYVHLHGGDIMSVPEVLSVQVTGDNIVFHRPAGDAVSYPREAVYFACCQQDEAPPQF